jgi:hypothetical protein
LEALGHDVAASHGELMLSRAGMSFRAREGRIPRAQTVSVRIDGGGAREWTAQASDGWIVLPDHKGKTPARVTIRVDPAKLAAGKHDGTVVFRDDIGRSIALAVSFQIGPAPAVAVRGDGCALHDDDGTLHVRAGAGCELRAADGEANGVQWRLPGGESIGGAQLFGHFVRPGRYQVLISRDEGEVDPLAVVIE